MEGLSLSWDAFLPRLATRLVERRDARAELAAVLDAAVDAGCGGRTGSGPAATAAAHDPTVLDPFTFLARLADTPDAAASFSAAGRALGMPFGVGDLAGFEALPGSPRFAADPEEADALWELFERALDAADAGRLSGVPTGSERTELLHAFQAVETFRSPALSLARISCVLAQVAPRDYPSLVGATGTFLRSPDGLAIAEEDIPATGLEYLSLIAFLDDEMAAARLPYRDFLEMARAAGEGRALAQGLSAADRRALVAQRIEPELRRLWPRDEARVAAELERLLAE